MRFWGKLEIYPLYSPGHNTRLAIWAVFHQWVRLHLSAMVKSLPGSRKEGCRAHFSLQARFLPFMPLPHFLTFSPLCRNAEQAPGLMGSPKVILRLLALLAGNGRGLRLRQRQSCPLFGQQGRICVVTEKAVRSVQP